MNYVKIFVTVQCGFVSNTLDKLLGACPRIAIVMKESWV